MRRSRLLVVAALATTIATPAARAGTVAIPVNAQSAPTNACTAGPAPDPSWPTVVQAATNPDPCDARVAFSAVPASRAADIVSAQATARIFGVSGFDFGLLAADGSVAGSVMVPPGDNAVQSSESTVPLDTTGGSVTLVLRSPTGTGEAWLSTPGTRSLVVTVKDVTPPTVSGPLTAIPANVLLPATVTAGARLTDNGPTTPGALSTISWGDGSPTEDVDTIAPINPFTTSLTTISIFHEYTTPGLYPIQIVARDSAGNAKTATLGTVRVWNVPFASVEPRVTGKIRLRSRLTCQTGSWSEVGGATPFSYRWLRSGGAIAGANGRSYVLRSGDRNKQITCGVTGHNPAGAAAEEVAVNHRFWVRPSLRSRPRVSGRARVGSTVACTQGSWRWSPRTFKYTWLRNGATTKNHGKHLKLRSSDSGKKLACRVTASNPAGRASATARSVTVKAKPPKKSGGGGGGSGCDPSNPTVCIPPPPPDLDCGEIPYRDFPVVGSDPHGFDGDNDGIGCES